MKYFILLCIILSINLSAQERYSQIRIPVQSAEAMKKLVDLGLTVDHFHGKIGRSIDVFFSESEIKILNSNNISYSVLIPDWHEHFSQTVEQSGSFSETTAIPSKYFRFGSMAGFLTYSEVIQQLDSMVLLYPSLITSKDSIGSTFEGRPIFALKISDNPNINEQSEPEALYTSLHHAREPQGMMTVIYYMWWLLENYGIDPEATYLVNNRQLWFIPVVNPDGYLHNQTINPGGGGMWRKNRRTNDGGSIGVDLNRNYGPDHMWNSPNGGSSTLPTSDIYRGITPFSEPETQTIEKFLRTKKIRTCFNYHTYSNLLIYPWGFLSQESPDSLLFRNWSFDMTSINRYAMGTDLQTVNYSTRGNSDDFMYGDTSNNKVRTFAMTPEVGSTGFWPSVNEILPLAMENLEMNKQLAYYAGHYPVVRHHWFEDTLGVGILSPRNKYLLKVTIENKGLSLGKNIKIDVSESTMMYSFESKIIHALAPLQDSTVSITVTQNNWNRDRVQLVISISDSSGFLQRDTIKAYTIHSEQLFSDDATNGISKWNIGSGWGTTPDAYSAPLAFTDSPDNKYKANDENSLTFKNPVFLPPPYNELRFRTKWAIEPTWDFGFVEASSDNGVTWRQLKTKHTRRASGRSDSKQPIGTNGYDGYNPSSLTSVVDSKKYWIEQVADLSEFNGASILVRFRLSSDSSEERDGWYLDDIQIIHYNFMPLSVTTNSTIAETYKLEQNYPNPFNPATTIQFSIPFESRVELSIFDVIGRKITTIVDSDLAAGSYSAKLDAEQLSSGIYFYRLVAGSYSAIKKMTLLK